MFLLMVSSGRGLTENRLQVYFLYPFYEDCDDSDLSALQFRRAYGRTNVRNRLFASPAVHFVQG